MFDFDQLRWDLVPERSFDQLWIADIARAVFVAFTERRQSQPTTT